MLPLGARLTPPVTDLGINFLGTGTEIEWSGPSNGALVWRSEVKNNISGEEALLLDGIVATNQDNRIWGGNFNYDPQTLFPIYPEYLTLTLPSPQGVSRVIIFSTEPDDQFCQLLDYNVQVLVGGAWQTVREVRSPMPPSMPVETYSTRLTTFADNARSHICEFPEVLTNKVRVEVLRVTLGSHVDEAVSNLVNKKYSNNDPGRFPISEIRVTGEQRAAITTYSAALSGSSAANARYFQVPSNADAPNRRCVVGVGNGRQIQRRVQGAGRGPQTGRRLKRLGLVASGGKLYFFVNSATGGDRALNNVSPIAGEWTILRVGRDMATNKIFCHVNGNGASTDYTKAVAVNNSPLYLGRGADPNTNFLNGSIDRVVFRKNGDVVSRYDFEDAADLGHDSVGQNHLTNVNGVTQTEGYNP